MDTSLWYIFVLALVWARTDDQIPEEVTEYYLQKSGFDCSDPRL